MKAENINRVIEFLNSQNIDIDFSYHLSNQDFKNADEVREILDDAGAFNAEIIYYSRAIQFLMDNDPSLRESLSIASEMGYTPEKLSSEILASLLASEQTRDEFISIESELDDLISEILEEEAEEEAEEEEENEEE